MRRSRCPRRAATGVDNLDPYYDVSLKEARLAKLAPHDGFRLARMDLTDARATADLFADGGFGQVVHLAAQPGVRHSLVNPGAYFANNLTAFGHVVEGCRHAKVAHLVYASSSSVYGANHQLPFSEDQNVDHPVSLYAATKKANELIAHSYSHLYRLPTTGLRFFTIYAVGPPRHGADAVHRAILAGLRSACTTKERCAAISPMSTASAKRSAGDGQAARRGRRRCAVRRLQHRQPRIGPLSAFIATLERLLGRSAIREHADAAR
jgi:nucleoside-diphosphate-sugar epimerase